MSRLFTPGTEKARDEECEQERQGQDQLAAPVSRRPEAFSRPELPQLVPLKSISLRFPWRRIGLDHGDQLSDELG